MYEDKRRRQAKQDKTIVLEHHLSGFMVDLLWGLNEQIDRRLVSTLFGLVMAIIMHRHRNHGLLLSELGGYLLGPGAVLCGHQADQQAVAQPEMESQDDQSISLGVGNSTSDRTAGRW